MMICLFLLLLFASSVNLQTITLPLPINGQIRGNYYGINDTVYIASGDNMLPQNLKDSFRFDEQKNLVVKTTSTQSLDFIIVYQNALDPIFEWCRSPEYKLCEDELIVCFDHSCSDASMFSLRYELHPVFNHIGDKSVTGACVHVHSSGLKIDQGEFVSSPVQINAQAFAQDVSLTQTFVHILGSTCGAILRFPKASLAFTESLSSPSTTTTAAERLSNSSVESSNGIFSTTPASHESNTWQLIAVIGGSIFGVILILGLIALVVYLCLRKKTSKKPTSKTGMKIVKLRATKSMESVANVVPSSPPKAAQPDPSKVTKPLPPTSKPVESKVPKTQPPKVLPIQPMLKTESTQSSGESVATAVEKREKCGVFFPREFSDDPTKTAEERTKEPSGDLSLIQTAYPRMDIDCSKPYSKLFEADFKVDLVQEISAPRQPKLIIPLLTQRIVDESVPESEYTPDCLAQQAFRLPLVEDRAAMLLQATIKANNQLFDLGFRRKISRRDPDVPVGYYVTAPEKSEKWLKELKEGNFLQFIVNAAEKSLEERWGEYGEDEMLWRNYAFISDVPECLRQACSIGQSKKRRHFFTMAVYYEMASLMKKLADEKSLGVFGYPVPLLLDIYREAPHYFAIVDTTSTEGNDVTK